MAIGKLNPVRVGLAGGILWGLLSFAMAVTAMYGWGASLVNLFSPLYIGYSASWTGAVIGFVWGFADCFVLGAVFSLIFNWAGDLEFLKKWD